MEMTERLVKELIKLYFMAYRNINKWEFTLNVENKEEIHVVIERHALEEH